MDIIDFVFGITMLGVIIPAFGIGFLIEWFSERE